MFRLGIIFALLTWHSAEFAMADSDYEPPRVGTQITWRMPTEIGSETRLMEVVANGPDFAIYLFDLRMSPEEPWSYFVEFSGVHSSSCNAEMLSSEERARLNALWPLQPGSETVVEDELEFKYKIDEATRYAVSQQYGNEAAQIMTKTIGDLRTKVTLSQEWNIPVREEWDDGRVESVIDVFIPPRPEQTLIGPQLGNCKALLE